MTAKNSCTYHGISNKHDCGHLFKAIVSSEATTHKISMSQQSITKNENEAINGYETGNVTHDQVFSQILNAAAKCTKQLYYYVSLVPKLAHNQELTIPTRLDTSNAYCMSSQCV